MPLAPLQPCARPGCPSLAVVGRHCAKHAKAEKAQKKQYDKQRGSSAKRGYGRKWQNYRKTYLAKHPLCVRCKEHGRITPATVVDHIKAHKGDMKLFWDPANHQATCSHCNTVKAVLYEGALGKKMKPIPVQQ